VTRNTFVSQKDIKMRLMKIFSQFQIFRGWNQSLFPTIIKYLLKKSRFLHLVQIHAFPITLVRIENKDQKKMTRNNLKRLSMRQTRCD
jgi:hypothetical protein